MGKPYSNKVPLREIQGVPPGQRAVTVVPINVLVPLWMVELLIARCDGQSLTKTLLTVLEEALNQPDEPEPDDDVDAAS